MGVAPEYQAHKACIEVAIRYITVYKWTWHILAKFCPVLVSVTYTHDECSYSHTLPRASITTHNEYDVALNLYRSIIHIIVHLFGYII